ncbi:MAG: thioredoxin family protein [Halobacteriota archaeon]
MSGEDKSEGVGKSGEAGMKPIGVLAIGLIIGILIGVVVVAFGFPQTPGFSASNVLTPEEAGTKAVDFIENYAVAPGVDVELVNVTEVEGANMYKIVVNLSAMGRSQMSESYMTKDGELLFPQAIDVEEFEAMVEQQKEQEENQTQESGPERTIGNFIVGGDEICKEDGKPIIYFFGADWCGGCRWEHPVMENVTAKFEGYISFHDINIDLDYSTADQEIFDKYSPEGYIPTIVLGCKYYRVGSGATMGEEQEAKVLTALICNLTDNKPADVCTDEEIEELITQI